MSNLKIYNTLAREKQVFVPMEAGKVRMYVCGMTIYDYCHIGHARMMMAFDVIYRWLQTSGYHVTYASNITDIDDKIIKRAVENGETISQLTSRFTQYMDEDTGALGILPATLVPRATEYVPQMLALIEALEAKDLAYQGADGDVNYAVRNFPNYGKLSGKSLDDLRAGERVDVNTEARSARFRAVEVVERVGTGRSQMGFQMGFGPSGLAYRVLGHVLRLARRTIRHPWRRRGLAVPAP